MYRQVMTWLPKTDSVSFSYILSKAREIAAISEGHFPDPGKFYPSPPSELPTVPSQGSRHRSEQRHPLPFLALTSYKDIPVFGIGREKIALDHDKRGHSIAKDVGTPQQRDPIVKDDGGREPEQEAGVSKPEEMCNEPGL